MKLFCYCLLALFTISLSACQKEKLTGTPAVTTHKNNVLLPVIQFETPDSTTAIITYRKEGSSFKQTSAPSSGKKHRIVLNNVTAESFYKYVIKYGDQTSEEFSFNTGPLPPGLFSVKKTKIDTTVFKGYILIRRFFAAGADAILNNEGDIVWYGQYDIPVRRAFAWTDRNTIISVYDSARIMERDLLGNTLLDLDLEKLKVPFKVQHEIFYDKDNNILALTTDSVQVKENGKTRFARGSGMIKLDKTGKLLWNWTLFTRVKYDDLLKKIENTKDVLGHANSIAIDKDGNYLISFRDFSQIWKINSVTGDLIWKFGKGGDFKMPEDSYFIRQHSIHFNEQGELMMFDNGRLETRKESRVVAFKLDESSMTATPTLIASLPPELSSYRMCSAYRIAGDRVLVCTTKKNSPLVVINSQGETLWKCVANPSSYRAYYIEDPFIRR